MKNTTIDIQAFINEHPSRKYCVDDSGLCFITIAMDGFDTAIIGFIASDLVGNRASKIGVRPGDERRLSRASSALTAGPLRRPQWAEKVLIMSIGCFGGFSLLTAFATSLNQLTLLRFHRPWAGRRHAERRDADERIRPERRRALMVNLMFVGFPMGSSLGGFLSAWMIPTTAKACWCLAEMPLLLAVVLISLLPNCAEYMVKRQTCPAYRRRS